MRRKCEDNKMEGNTRTKRKSGIIWERKGKQKRLTLRRAVYRTNPPAGERTGNFGIFASADTKEERKSWEMHK